MSNSASPDVLEDLPPSSVLAYHVLAQEGPMTVSDLRETAYLADKTARRALSRLEDVGLVDKRPGPDARETLYELDS